MFVNLETSDFRESLKAAEEARWHAIAVDILRNNDRSVAVGKIAEALQQYACELPAPIEPMHAALYALALARIDFFTLALELILGAEASDPTLIEEPKTKTEVDEDWLAA